jgi:hypothetical protein
VDTGNFDNASVIGLDVEYRYKNKNKFTGNAETIGESYIYSDWNKMDSFMNAKTPAYDPVTGKYSYKWGDHNESMNEPSFNQIDIPISQGENVDIRVRFIYNLGWPLITFRSDWSEILNIDFPEEFVKDIEILDIIEENNSDIKQQQFIGILEKEGILDHVYDKIKDMDLTYFHQPEHIASGFYTPERRVIPLSDQLATMARALSDLQTEVNGATAQLVLTLSDGIQESTLLPGIMNNFRVRSYVDAVNEGDYQTIKFVRDPSHPDETLDTPLAVSNMVINIYNPSEYVIKLHSLFPGDNSTILDDSLSSNRFGYLNYVGGGYCTTENTDPKSSNIGGYNYDPSAGVWMMMSDINNPNQQRILQRQNQFLYFRTVVDGKSLYTVGLYDGNSFNNTRQSVSDDNFNGKFPENLLSAGNNNILELEDYLYYMYDSSDVLYKGIAGLYPSIGGIEEICAPAGSSFYELKPGESVQIPLNFAYWISNNKNSSIQSAGDLSSNVEAKMKPYINKISRAIAFDIRTSLFADPVTYKITVSAHYQDLQTFKSTRVNKQSVKKQYSPTTVVTQLKIGK